MEAWWDFLPLFLRQLLIAAALGGVIGLEREFSTRTERGHMAGLRTFPLFAILGFTAAHLSLRIQSIIFPVVLAAVILLISLAYFAQTRERKYGLTTEVSLILCFAGGAMVAFGLITEALGVTVLVAVLLSLKEEFHWFVRQITQEELLAFLKFAVLALLVLPVLPDQSFGPGGRLNYRELGWIVVLVLGISFTAYLLLKFSDQRRGILLTALVGGMLSSTMIAWVFGAKSRVEGAPVKLYATGIVLSSTVMFLRVLFLTFLFNPHLARALLAPCLLMAAGGISVIWREIRSDSGEKNAGVLPLGNPLDIRNAILFSLIYVLVAMVMYYSRQWLGEGGVYLTGFLAGLADLDAVTINVSKWYQEADAVLLAARVLLLAILANNAFKLIIALLQSDRSARSFLLRGFGAMLLAGMLSLVYFFVF